MKKIFSSILPPNKPLDVGSKARTTCKVHESRWRTDQVFEFIPVWRYNSQGRRSRWKGPRYYMTMFIQRLVGRKKKAVISNEVKFFFVSVFASLTGRILSHFIIFSCLFEIFVFSSYCKVFGNAI
jgi:hypothetical protein